MHQPLIADQAQFTPGGADKAEARVDMGNNPFSIFQCWMP